MFDPRWLHLSSSGELCDELSQGLMSPLRALLLFIALTACSAFTLAPRVPTVAIASATVRQPPTNKIPAPFASLCP